MITLIVIRCIKMIRIQMGCIEKQSVKILLYIRYDYIIKNNYLYNKIR